MQQLVLLLLSPMFTIVLFIGTIACQFMAGSALQKGNLDKGRKLVAATFLGATLIVLHEVVSFAVLRSSLSLVMAILWTWLAWIDYQWLQRIPKKK
jgi:hypothetical protein